MENIQGDLDEGDKPSLLNDVLRALSGLPAEIEGERERQSREKTRLGESQETPLCVHTAVIQTDTTLNPVTIRPDRVARWISIVTMLLLLATATFTYRQWVAMNATYCEMRQQTALMQKQLEAATAAIITRQFRITWPTKQAYLSVILDNRGKAAGTDIHADFQLIRVSLPDGKAIGKPLPNWAFAISEIESSPVLPKERGIPLDIGLEDLSGIGIPKAIRLTGTFSYFNGFRKDSESACYYILGEVHFLDKLGKVGQSGGSTVVACDSLSAQIAWYRTNEANARQ